MNSATASDAASYYVTVSNSSGSATSSVASVTVNQVVTPPGSDRLNYGFGDIGCSPRLPGNSSNSSFCRNASSISPVVLRSVQ